MLLPPNLETMIPEKHLVRVVNSTIDSLNIEPLIGTYKGGGASAYHPKMMLKVIIYAYLSKIYASRQIAKALRQDIYFMWLSGMHQPKFSIINQFRSSRLKSVVDKIFGSMVKFLLENNYIDFCGILYLWHEAQGRCQSIQSGVGEEYKTLQGDGGGEDKGTFGGDRADQCGRTEALRGRRPFGMRGIDYTQ